MAPASPSIVISVVPAISPVRWRSSRRQLRKARGDLPARRREGIESGGHILVLVAAFRGQLVAVDVGQSRALLHQHPIQAHAIAVAIDIAQMADMLDQGKAAASRLGSPPVAADPRHELIHLRRHGAQRGGDGREIVRPMRDQILDAAVQGARDPCHHLQRAGPLAAFDLRQISPADPDQGCQLRLVERAVVPPGPHRVRALRDGVLNRAGNRRSSRAGGAPLRGGEQGLILLPRQDRVLRAAIGMPQNGDVWLGLGHRTLRYSAR